MWQIDKQFDFCYGHRVWSQQLTEEFCEVGDYCTKCRHLHGHQGELHVFLEGDELIRGMVTDFKHLGWLKNFIDDHIDHKFIIDMNDPWFEQIINGRFDSVPEYSKSKVLLLRDKRDLHYLVPRPILIPNTEYWMGYELDVSELTGPEQEFYEGFFIVDFLPTSENLCRWLFEAVQSKMVRLGVKVQRVEFNETPKSRSTYIR